MENNFAEKRKYPRHKSEPSPQVLFDPVTTGEYFLEKPIVIKYKNQNKLQVGLVPKKQKLYISCNKNKADIFINNQRLNNKTPAYIHDLDVGTYNIRIEKTTFKNKYYYNYSKDDFPK